MITKSDLKSDTVKSSLISLAQSFITLTLSLLAVWGVVDTQVNSKLNESIIIIMSMGSVIISYAVYTKTRYNSLYKKYTESVQNVRLLESLQARTKLAFDQLSDARQKDQAVLKELDKSYEQLAKDNNITKKRLNEVKRQNEDIFNTKLPGDINSVLNDKIRRSTGND